MFPRSSMRGAAYAKKLNLTLLAIWLVVFLFYSYLALSLPHRSSFLSPDENNTYCVARQIRENHTIYIRSRLNEELGMKIFRGRLFVEAKPNAYTAFNSLGLSFLVAGGMYVGSPFLVVPFLASLGVIGIYLIAREMAGRTAGYLAALLYGLLPTNVFHSNQILDITPSFAMYFLSLGCVIAAASGGSVLLSAISGLALGLSFFIRQANAFYILILLAFLLTLRKKLSLGQKLAFLLPSVLIAALTILMNKLVYGSLFRSGQVAGAETSAHRILIPKLNPGDVVHVLSAHLIAYIPILLTLGLVGYSLAWGKKVGTKLKSLNVFMVAMISMTLLIYASRPGTWSFETFSITSSMSRYLIPVYAAVIIYASFCLYHISITGRGKAAVLLTTAILCSYALFTFGPLENMNLQRLKKRAEVYGRAKESLLNAYHQPIVVFTKRMDKDLFDDVQVGLCYTQEDLNHNPDIKYLLPIVDIEKDVLPAIYRLRDEGYLVFAAADCEELLASLTENGYQILQESEYGSLFLVRKGEQP